ncbi:MAG: hypothetical protein CMO55_10285 [Verrucomicrobiales bacterium]|nr:hypothetical protein [Verrucomicrobiales bacterium]
MTIVLLADDDSLVGRLDVMKCDLLLCLGDLWDSTIEKARDRYQPERVFAVRGNHDSAAPFAGFVTDLHLTATAFGGMRFGGFGGSWKYKPRGHHLYEQEEVNAALRDFPAVDVFVAHNSPRGIHERDSDVHQGFDAFREYIARAKPKYFFHGHQHFNEETVIGDTRVIGVFGERVMEV